MGQYLELSKEFLKKKELPQSLLPLKQKGFLKAFFNLKETRDLLKSTGDIIDRIYRGNEKLYK